jgi:hypothetical protein
LISDITDFVPVATKDSDLYVTQFDNSVVELLELKWISWV